MPVLTVGKLYNEGTYRYSEGIRFNIDDSGCILQLFFSHPKERELESVKSDKKLEIGFYVEDEVMLLTFKFGKMNRVDAPYNINLSKNLYKIQDIENGMGLALLVNMVDASNGILKTNRLIGLPTDFSRKLKLAIEKQATMLFNEVQYDLKIREIYAKYCSDELYDRASETCTIKPYLQKIRQ